MIGDEHDDEEWDDSDALERARDSARQWRDLVDLRDDGWAELGRMEWRPW